MSLFGNNIINYRDDYILNEAYIGKTDTLLEIEKEFSAFLAEKHKKTEPLSTNPHILKINKLFEKQFGMEICALKIVPNDVVNGYTKVIGTRFDVAKDIDLSTVVTGDINNGFRFKPDNGFIVLVYLYYGLLFFPNITGGEILAIILHEIGHNFADCLYDTIRFDNRDMMLRWEEYIIKLGINKGLLAALSKGVSVRDYFELRNLYRDMNNANMKKDEEKFRSKSKASHKYKALFDGLKAGYTDFKDLIKSVYRRVTSASNIAKYIRMQGEAKKGQVRKSVSRQNEVFADKFAAVYGYGPELANGLAKMELTNSKADDIISKLPQMFRDAALEYEKQAMKLNDYDCHPAHVQRLRETIMTLERELSKDDIDPRVKEAINSQLEELRDILKQIMDVDKQTTDKAKAQALYNAYVNDNCPTAVDGEIEDAIEDALDKLLEESKKKNKKGKK